MSSFASVKGPSITVRFPPEYLMRQPFELGWSPETSSSTPAFTSSSWYVVIAAMSFSSGMTPASVSLLPLTIIMNRIVLPPCGCVEEPRVVLRLQFLGLRAQTRLLLPELGGERRTEVLHLEHLANLDLALLEGAAFNPFDRLGHRLHPPQPEAGDQLFRLRERPVDHGPLRSREPDAHALRARVEPLAREHHARLCQLFVELPHVGDDLLVGQNACLRFLVRF